MKQLHLWLKGKIFSVVDFFYPPFKKYIPQQTFRYAVCGGANMCLSLALYPLLYHFVFKKTLFSLPFITFTPHVASLFAVSLITLPIGFYLSMFVVFPGSHLRRRVQFARYFLITICNVFLNYILLKLFVDVLHWYATPSYYLTVAIVVTFTYLTQRHFTFRQQNSGQI